MQSRGVERFPHYFLDESGNLSIKAENHYIFKKRRIKNYLKLLTDENFYTALKNTIKYVLMITIIQAMKLFTQSYIMTKGGPQNKTKTMVYYIYEQGFQKFRLRLLYRGHILFHSCISVTGS